MTVSSHTPVKIPLHRRVTPTIMATNILGASPLAAPYSFNWKVIDTLTRRCTLPPETYGHFLRLNNRRRTQTGHDFKQAGYPHVSLHKPGFSDQIDVWCNLQFGDHTWWRFSWSYTWWFSTHDQATMFGVSWS